MYPNRTMCDVLSEMRKCNETRNYTYLLGLIEECQSMGNRMEAALYDQNDYEEGLEKKQEIKKELKELEAERDALKRFLEDSGLRDREKKEKRSRSIIED